MKRRNFIQLSTLAGIGLSLPMAGLLNACESHPEHSLEFKNLISGLLKNWCDGMIKVQINNPANLEEHGALNCPSCSHIHGRCMDAVYPFLYMADVSGDEKYIKAAKLVMTWAENNVSQEDGAWTVIRNPKSWKGITVFGAIALAEALYYHGHVLDEATQKEWTKRLDKAGQYIYDTFTIDFTNINYPGTAVYGLNLIGGILNRDDFKAKSKTLASQVKSYFTANEGLLFGECKKSSSKLSEKGLHGVDLGYNVEETLNSLVMYALKEKDEELLQILTKSLNSHLEFMLPDGAWDNSWGTRQYKWSYWGSRTCDGSQPAFGMMAHINPAFGTAAVKNTELLQRCTADGLIHGGPGFIEAGIPPCVHHTFTHAKPLAALLDHWEHLPEINADTNLPRTNADGVKHFKDLDVFLFARGDWRGTVSAYDAEYHYKDDYRQASGGALGVLYHNKVGLLCAASMAEYHLVEKNNQQLQPGKDIALTPRIETFKEDIWYTNLYDLPATVSSKDESGTIELLANVKLKDNDRKIVEETASAFDIIYQCSVDEMQIRVKTNQVISIPTAFVLPIISPTEEVVNKISENEMTIQKPEGLVIIKASAPITIKEMEGDRTFNMVPGVEALPLEVFFESTANELSIVITVS
ncbi:hypothetical protein [Jejuia pallidilutea]|uniref:Uncharacterized protein n=1 Tax=Jejuia pallidilutea TaxID=504487 RepID=A0A090W1Q1_9FLAO|nr:hypothetical protein [Jejuia pallidilutea]GAL67222.1 hypothetical protein JCM19301_1834 [Jejuia pallidilutea]GAL70861.1 hypothetical protein JCM19302_2024 [Jejuia pallidilutea]GAL89782.1 hypothetical protein JCM19538_3259 [Jejuia pallidilutea]